MHNGDCDVQSISVIAQWENALFAVTISKGSGFRSDRKDVEVAGPLGELEPKRFFRCG